MAGLRKRSVQLSGHATSLALEPEFWSVLEEMAATDGVSLAALIVRIDAGRRDRPLASACRLAALAFSRRPELGQTPEEQRGSGRAAAQS